MTLPNFVKLVQYEAPGQTCAALLDQTGRPCRIFIERWHGAEAYARFGSVHRARLRRFADDIQGAFLELESGEEAFLRLKSRGALTEGAALTVKTESERRRDKLARVSVTAQSENAADNFSRWQRQVTHAHALRAETDRARVEAAIDEACSMQVTLPSGGHLHIERTRALTAVDIDTAGRRQKGSAGAKALSINREAATELARQIALRGLGGTIVLDCVEPLNKEARGKLQAAAVEALQAYGLTGARVLPPSALGLMEISLPWHYCPIEDRLLDNPAETELLSLFREVQREAEADRTAFFEIQICNPVRATYLARRNDCYAALRAFFAGRVTVGQDEAAENKVLKR